MPAPDRRERKLALIDGYSLVHRAFFALPPLQAADGQPTNAVYGFLTMLLRLLAEEQPTHAVIAFDAPGPTVRDRLFADYKAHRPSTPDDLRSQFPLVRDACAKLRIPIVEAAGYEADDVIGTVASQAAAAGFDVLIVTGDRDVLQLVNDRVRALITRRGITNLQLYDVAAIREQYELEPKQLIDVKALMGDPSDNIPGVPGIGEKTAVRLIRQFGDVESVLANAEQVGGKKLSAALREHAETARVSLQLARIITDVPLQPEWDAWRRQPPDVDGTRELFTRLQFRTLLDRLGIDRVATESQVGIGTERGAAADTGDDVDRQIISEPEMLAEVGEQLQAADQIAVSYRLEADNARRSRLMYAAFTNGDTTYFLTGLPEQSILTLCGALLQRAAAGQTTLVVHDLKPLLTRCYQSGTLKPDTVLFPGGDRDLPLSPPVAGDDDGGSGSIADAATDQALPRIFDVTIAAYLLDPTRSNYLVRDLLDQHLGVSIPEPEDLLPRERRRSGGHLLQLAGLEQVATVVARQGRLLFKLARALNDEIVARGMAMLLRRIEAPLTEVLAQTEHFGVHIDRAALAAMGEELKQRITELQNQIHHLAGTEFNINSPQQLGEVLFDRLGLPAGKRTKTGYSTDAEVLEQLALEHPIAALVLEYRTLVKLMGTYVDGLAETIEADERIHTTFQQTVAATGRLASTSPNLQNIPIREQPGRRLRQAFVAEPGNVLLACDYSQIELRVLAHMSGDERMVEAFHHGQDIHARTAADVFGVPLEAVTPRQRDMAKAVNFGIVYGISDFGLARQLRIPREEARSFIKRYFEQYAGVQRYLQQAVADARAQGFVRTLFGRIRYLPELKSRIMHRRAFAERTAMNTPIQGTAADIIKAAMVGVHARLRSEELAGRLILQIHDELILEVPQQELDTVAALVVDLMSGAVALDVPLVVEAKAGTNWYEMRQLEVRANA